MCFPHAGVLVLALLLPSSPRTGYSRRRTSSPVGTLATGTGCQRCPGRSTANAGHTTGEFLPWFSFKFTRRPPCCSLLKGLVFVCSRYLHSVEPFGRFKTGTYTFLGEKEQSTCYLSVPSREDAIETFLSNSAANKGSG